MVPDSPADALGLHAQSVRSVLIEVVRSRHDRSAEAHQAAATRYSMGFSSQWRDLLADAHDALTDLGFQSYKLSPGGYKLPVVNDCLVYVWRVPDAVDAVAEFASSPTKKNSFIAPMPPPTLFDPSFIHGAEPVDEAPEQPDLERVVQAVGDTMPLVLVMVQSSPRQLQSIEWAIAELDEASEKVKLHGSEIIWQPEPIVEGVVSAVESFDSGAPAVPAVELQKQDGSQPDA